MLLCTRKRNGYGKAVYGRSFAHCSLTSLVSVSHESHENNRRSRLALGLASQVSPCDLSDTLRVFCALGSLLPYRAYYLATLPLSLARRTLAPPHLHAAERAIAQPGRVRVRRVGWARARADTGRLVAQLLTATARG